MTTAFDRFHKGRISRRAFMLSAAAAGAAATFGIAGRVAAQAGLKPIKLAWNANAACLAPVAVGVSQDLYRKHGLAVELINYVGSTDQLLESLATGKADAAVGMALRWLKPLEQGFDVKLVGATHGGCLHLLAAKGRGVTNDITSLKGKVVAVADMGGPPKNFFSMLAGKRGLDPVKDIEWRQYPADLLALAVEKGEAHALADQDPLTYKFLKNPNLFEVASNLSAEYASRLCCVVGVRGSLLREDRSAVASIVRALLEAQDITAANPRLTAEAFQPYSAKTSIDDLTEILKSQTHHHHPLGTDFKKELVLYAEELKQISVLKPTTDPVKFAERIYTDVLA